VRRLQVTAKVPSSQILVTLLMEAQSSSETSALTRAARRNIPEDAILLRHHREHLKSYKAEPGSYLLLLITFPFFDHEDGGDIVLRNMVDFQQATSQ
jgi:hypothetical protein